jgi:hypothetical protein
VILIKYGFDIEVQLFQRTTVLTAMDLHPSRRDDVVMESTFRAANASTSESFLDSFGNLCRRVVASYGSLTLSLEGIARDSGRVDDTEATAELIPVEALPVSVLPFLSASRYCETDLASHSARRVCYCHSIRRSLRET